MFALGFAENMAVDCQAGDASAPILLGAACLDMRPFFSLVDAHRALAGAHMGEGGDEGGTSGRIVAAMGQLVLR